MWFVMTPVMQMTLMMMVGTAHPFRKEELDHYRCFDI